MVAPPWTVGGVNPRRVFSRFDEYARRYLAFVQFASTCIWLK